MVAYCLKIAPHYSGLICGSFPDLPGLIVIGRDHKEVTDLAVAALEAELEQLMKRDGCLPRPQIKGRLTISTTKFG